MEQSGAMAHPDDSDYTPYVPTSRRVIELQHRLEEMAQASNDRDNDVDERFAEMEADIKTLRYFCLAFGFLVLTETVVVVMMALGILRVGG